MARLKVIFKFCKVVTLTKDVGQHTVELPSMHCNDAGQDVENELYNISHWVAITFDYLVFIKVKQARKARRCDSYLQI